MIVRRKRNCVGQILNCAGSGRPVNAVEAAAFNQRWHLQDSLYAYLLEDGEKPQGPAPSSLLLLLLLLLSQGRPIEQEHEQEQEIQISISTIS